MSATIGAFPALIRNYDRPTNQYTKQSPDPLNPVNDQSTNQPTKPRTQGFIRGRYTSDKREWPKLTSYLGFFFKYDGNQK